MARHYIIVLEFLCMHLREALGHVVPIKSLLGSRHSLRLFDTYLDPMVKVLLLSVSLRLRRPNSRRGL